MRVLLVRLGAFGDILHTLPLAADLVAAGHSVGWLCEDRWAPVLEGSPAIARIHRLPRKILRTGSFAARLEAIRTTVTELRLRHYDVAIDAQGLAKSAAWALASESLLRLGHARPRAREGSWWAYHRRQPMRSVHVIDQQRDLGRLLGAVPHGAWQFPLPPWEQERVWAASWLAEQRAGRPWMLNVGAGWPTKVWPLERQIAFAAELRTRSIPLVLAWGSPVERSVAEAVLNAADHGWLAPATTIPQLAGLLAGAAVMVSGDTGPLHLALALGTPAVGLFGPVPAERNGPRGAGYRTLQAPGAAWERKDVSKVDMAAIQATQVYAAAESALQDHSGPS
jgi:heptosyltransferase-1